MGRERRNLPAAVAGGPKERHKRAQRSQYDPKAPVPEGFVAKPAIPKTKYHSYFEFVENKDKKKKLEFKITSRKTPPPGFEFVPIGNPQLTTACKELSRGKDAMIFIVSVCGHNSACNLLVTDPPTAQNSKEVDSNHLAHQVHRIGHHIREIIVDEARATLGQPLDYTAPALGRSPEPIPKSQEEYNAQVDAAIRDLFPRVPNTDRQMIIEHAFRRGTTFKGDKPVGLSADITLARRVQLAVLAHIRHTHTRYDTLLRETTWQNARKIVEGLCLDTLVKWRGDEETGRDQLDEILREVVVISDSEDEDSDQGTEESSIEEIEPSSRATVPARIERNVPGFTSAGRRRSPKEANIHNGPLTPAKSKGKVQKSNRKNASDKKGQKGFKRYHAWQEAIRRYREEQDPELQPPPMDRIPSYPVHRQVTPRPAAPYMSHEFPDSSGLRIESKDAGPVPTENGYVVQHPSYSGQPMDLSRHSYSPLPRPTVHDKVISSREVHPSMAALHQLPPMVTNPLQDMLVPSIEPASPEYMRPSFVRAIPPRSQGFGNGTSSGSNMQYSPRRLSPMRGAIIRDDQNFPNRQGAQPPTRLNPLAGPYGDHHRQTSNIPREQQYLSARNGYPVSDSLAYHSNGHLAEASRHPASVRRPVEEVSRPGPRSTPVLMEDRGGFFEIISARPLDTHSPPRTTNMMDFRQPVHREVRRAPENHRVVSSREGSRILRETQGSARVEFIPVTTTRPLPFDHRSRTVPSDSAVIQQRTPSNLIHTRGVNDGHYPMYAQRPQGEPQPVDQEPYREVRYDERLQRAQHHEPVHQLYDNEPPPREDQYNPRRGYPLRRHRPEDVLVLE
ncbi:hypothetical protein AK830_g3218 [Neonectria ditissima]|uniref:DUF2293 domain-containing protein n=1 Tax=Neonectria ditissima TaxID=78410 RepID=A0A0P7B9C1_9HYPO|nr:hypothetical protein AK830_g3218 [Neonectria ditissima]